MAAALDHSMTTTAFALDGYQDHENARRCPRRHRTIALDPRDHRRVAADAGRRQHHPADRALREDPRRRVRAGAAAGAIARRERRHRPALRRHRGDGRGDRSPLLRHRRGRHPRMSATVRGSEASVEARSAGLKRELGLTDLVFTQILFIVGLPWVGVAAKQGPSHVVFWLIALALFYVPSAVVVIHLNRLMPLEGGLYQWAKLGFNEMTGFLVAWNLWLFAILNTSETGLQATQYLVYVVGPTRRVAGGAASGSSRWSSTAIIGGAGRHRHRRPERRQVGAQGRRRADAGDVRGAARCAVAERARRHARGVPSARHRGAGRLADEPQPARQDGLRRVRRLRVRGDSCRRVPQPGAEHRAGRW